MKAAGTRFGRTKKVALGELTPPVLDFPVKLLQDHPVEWVEGCTLPLHHKLPAPFRRAGFAVVHGSFGDRRSESSCNPRTFSKLNM